MKKVIAIRLRAAASAALLLVLSAVLSRAQSGFIRSAGQPIPGATVTASQGDRSVSTITDADGHYAFGPLDPGPWTVHIEIFGFEPVTEQINFGQAKGPTNFDLRLKSFEPAQPRPTPGAYAARNPNRQAPDAYAAGTANRQAQGQEEQTPLLPSQEGLSETATGVTNPSGSNEEFLVSGSLSPGMQAGRQADSGPEAGFNPRAPGGGDITSDNGPAGFQTTPGFGGGGAPGPPGMGGGGPGGGRGRGSGGGGPGFGRRPGGQVAGASFGNRRRRNQQIRGQASFRLANSAVNAKPFSLNGLDIPQAAYAQSRFSLILGGPLVIPKIVKDPDTQFFLTYFGTRSKTPQLFVETVPTAAERTGDFSQATQSLGTTAANVPIVLFNPTTHTPFAQNMIPASKLNGIALGLLRFYPLPNEPGFANNYQFETAQAGDTDNVGFRIQRNVTRKDRLALNLQYQRRDGTVAQPFGYSDTNSGYGINTNLQWTRNLAATVISNAQIRFNRNFTQVVPYFSTQPDVAQQLGIPGTSSNPIDFGPPTLNFTNFASLSDSTASLTRNQTQSGTESITFLKGVHSVTVGFSFTRADLSTQTDPNGRGTFSFTGLLTSQLDARGQPVTGTGYDLADFLLGLPQSSSIRYGATSNYFFENQYVTYAQDEWKMRPNLTLTLGVRYEYFTPWAEKYGRMANLD
ncbi:MAG: TonB-dependent receptor, partial [Acidobacteriaceae bacterium]|nr:TonB-dependent receptor [Acidobacteriaceae bacterium]